MLRNPKHGGRFGSGQGNRERPRPGFLVQVDPLPPFFYQAGLCHTLVQVPVVTLNSSATIFRADSGQFVKSFVQGFPTMWSCGRKSYLMATFCALAVAAGCTGFFVNPTLSSLQIGPSNQTITVNPLVKLQMSATGTFSDGSTQDLTGKVLWSSSDTSCATINTNGLVTPATSVAGLCTTNIGAADGTVNASASSVTVTQGTPTSITLTVSNSSPPVGSQVTFTAQALFPGSGLQDITSSVSWNNSDTTNLTLSQGSGVGTISATAPAETISVSATFDNVTSNTVNLNVP